MNWPEGVAPSLSSEQRTDLRATTGEVSPEVLERMNALVVRWGTPDLLSETD